MHDQTVEYYEKRASEYDKVYLRDNPGRQEELAKLYALSQQTMAGRTVLDLACGTGFWTRIVSQTACSIIGVDINPATLAVAGNKSYDCPVDFVRGDVYDLPSLSTSPDALMATFLISHIRRQDIPALGDRLKQVLPPQAPLFLCDNNLICELIPELIQGEDGINTYKKRRLENGEEYIILKNYFEREELENIFGAWGKIRAIDIGEFYWAVIVTLI